MQFSGADGRHQQIVGGTDNLYGAANACSVAAEIGLFQGMQPAQQIGFALKMGQRQRVLGLQPRGAGGHPVCRVEEQRLCLYPRLRAARMQQTFANVKTAAGMGIEGQPAVDADQRGEGVGLIDGQPQADQRPSAWPTTQ